MIEILKLDDQWLDMSYKKLCSGLSLSRLVATTVDWYAGDIVAWVPSEVSQYIFQNVDNFDANVEANRLFDYDL